MAKSRNVTYTLDIEAGKGNAATATAAVNHFKEVERAAKAAEAAIKGANSARTKGGSGTGGKGGFDAGYSKATRDEAKRVAADERRENEANIKAVAAARKAASKEEVAAQKAAAKDVLNARKAASKEAADFDRQMAKHVNTLGKQAGQREQAGKQSQAATAKMWNDVGSAVTAAAHGVTQYSRAVVLASVADEESAQRMLQKIAKVEAFAAAIGGTIQILKAGTSAWKAYQAAQAVGSLAQGAGGIARGAGGQIAGGLAVGGGVAGAKSLGGAALGAATNPLTAVAALTAGVIAAGYSIVRAKQAGKSAMDGLRDTGNLLMEGITEFLGITDRAGDNAKAWKQRNARVAQQIAIAGATAEHNSDVKRIGRGADADIAAARAGLGIGSFTSNRDEMIAGTNAGGVESQARALAEAKARQAAAARNVAEDERAAFIAEGDHSPQGAANHRGTLADLAQSTALEIESRRTVLGIEQQIKREQADAARQTLSGLQDRKKALQGVLDEEKKAGMSAAARFGAMSESEQQATLRSVRKYKAGERLGREDEDRIGALGGGANDIADESRRKRAYEAGYGEVDTGIFQPRVAAASAAVVNATTSITNQVDVVLKVESEAKSMADEFAKIAIPFLEKSRQQTIDAATAAFQKYISEQALRDGTGGG